MAINRKNSLGTTNNPLEARVMLDASDAESVLDSTTSDLPEYTEIETQLGTAVRADEIPPTSGTKRLIEKLGLGETQPVYVESTFDLEDIDFASLWDTDDELVDEELVDEELVDEELVDEELVDEELVDEELEDGDEETVGKSVSVSKRMQRIQARRMARRIGRRMARIAERQVFSTSNNSVDFGGDSDELISAENELAPDNDMLVDDLVSESATAILEDVTEGESVLGVETEGEATGAVSLSFSDEGGFELDGSFDGLPVPEEGTFFEGWLVNAAEGFELSTGEATAEADGTFVNTFTADENLLEDFDQFVLTIEPDDGDPAPADPILVGALEAEEVVVGQMDAGEELDLEEPLAGVGLEDEESDSEIVVSNVPPVVETVENLLEGEFLNDEES